MCTLEAVNLVQGTLQCARVQAQPDSCGLFKLLICIGRLVSV